MKQLKQPPYPDIQAAAVTNLKVKLLFPEVSQS